MLRLLLVAVICVTMQRPHDVFRACNVSFDEASHFRWFSRHNGTSAKPTNDCARNAAPKAKNMSSIIFSLSDIVLLLQMKNDTTQDEK